MTKKIIDMLDLPELPPAPEDDNEMTELMRNVNKQLGAQNDHEVAMDAIYKEAFRHANDIMDMGYNADPRSRSAMFEKGNMLYSTAITAMTNKADIRLKKMKLALDARKMDLDEAKFKREIGEKTDGEIDGEYSILDRNELLKKIKEEEDKKKS